MPNKTVDDVDALLELLAGRKKGRTKGGLSVEEAQVPLRSIMQHPAVQFRERLSSHTLAWLRGLVRDGGELDPAVVVACIIEKAPDEGTPDVVRAIRDGDPPELVRHLAGDGFHRLCIIEKLYEKARAEALEAGTDPDAVPEPLVKVKIVRGAQDPLAVAQTLNILINIAPQTPVNESETQRAILVLHQLYPAWSMEQIGRRVRRSAVQVMRILHQEEVRQVLHQSGIVTYVTTGASKRVLVSNLILQVLHGVPRSAWAELAKVIKAERLTADDLRAAISRVEAISEGDWSALGPDIDGIDGAQAHRYWLGLLTSDASGEVLRLRLAHAANREGWTDEELLRSAHYLAGLSGDNEERAQMLRGDVPPSNWMQQPEPEVPPQPVQPSPTSTAEAPVTGGLVGPDAAAGAAQAPATPSQPLDPLASVALSYDEQGRPVVPVVPPTVQKEAGKKVQDALAGTGRALGTPLNRAWVGQVLRNVVKGHLDGGLELAAALEQGLGTWREAVAAAALTPPEQEAVCAATALLLGYVHAPGEGVGARGVLPQAMDMRYALKGSAQALAKFKGPPGTTLRFAPNGALVEDTPQAQTVAQSAPQELAESVAQQSAQPPAQEPLVLGALPVKEAARPAEVVAPPSGSAALPQTEPVTPEPAVPLGEQTTEQIQQQLAGYLREVKDCCAQIEQRLHSNRVAEKEAWDGLGALEARAQPLREELGRRGVADPWDRPPVRQGQVTSAVNRMSDLLPASEPQALSAAERQQQVLACRGVMQQLRALFVAWEIVYTRLRIELRDRGETVPPDLGASVKGWPTTLLRESQRQPKDVREQLVVKLGGVLPTEPPASAPAPQPSQDQGLSERNRLYGLSPITEEDKRQARRGVHWKDPPTLPHSVSPSRPEPPVVPWSEMSPAAQQYMRNMGLGPPEEDDETEA